MGLRDEICNGRILLDGGMGTMLQRQGLPLGEYPEILSITNPKEIEAIHRAYLEAGSRMIYTNTFGATGRKLRGCGHSVEEVVRAAVSCAKRAAAPYGAWVALDIGPCGELLEPMGTLSFEEAVELFAQEVRAGVAAGVDAIVVETMTDLGEARAAVLAAKENSSLPVLCTMTFEETKRTFTGASVESMALVMEGLGVDAVGINCSLGPAQILPIAEELARWTTLPLIIKPNAGLPSLDGGEMYTLTPEEFANQMVPYLEMGARLVGGCCGTDPAYIRAIAARMGEHPPVDRPVKRRRAVCSDSRAVELDRARVIGERINPSGRQSLRHALARGDLDLLLREGVSQMEQGADLLDVNVGVPQTDEPALMARAVRELQGVVNLPLVLDSSDPRALEAGLRVYSGKGVVNSVNGEDRVLDRVLPLVKKYGAAVIGLTMDDRGIPPTAEDRLAIGEKILRRAEEEGIRREDVFLDCLCLTASAQQELAGVTLRTLSLVREKLGVETVLGLSNISFGLPGRRLLNRTFLAQALAAGLTLPILDPGARTLLDVVACHHLLTGADQGGRDYIARFASRGDELPPPQNDLVQVRDVGYCILHSLREEAKAACLELLERKDPMEVVSQDLIPALDQVGRQYEEGTLYLPQLISAAESAKDAFQLVRDRLSAAQRTDNSFVVVLATVQGDVHDIGKNIVKVVLENYGCRIVDLGRDVAPEAVLETARREGAAMVGLSALMTTTLDSMERTVRLLREEGLPAKIVVGGAVLTADYSRKIGADYYAKDAQEAVRILKEIQGRCQPEE